MGKTAVLFEGVPSDDELEQMLDALEITEAEEEEAEPPAADEEDPVDEEEVEEEEEEPPAADEEDEDPDAEIGTAVEALSVALANTFAMYLRAHVFHWNTVGPNFVTDHAYLGELAAELYGAIDPMAENIRLLGGMTPSGLGEFASRSTVEDPGTPEAVAPAMWEELLAANDTVTLSLTMLFIAANETGDQGLLNFVADRLAAHAKHGWFLRSLLGQTGPA